MIGVRTFVLLFLGFAFVLPGLDAGAAEGKGKASLRAQSFSPLVLQGQRFRPLERVALTVRAEGSTRRKAVRATRAGSFTVSFPALAADRCNSDVWAQAAGRRGSTASLRLAKLPQFQCPPAIP
jgi:hypothetical protein